MLIPILNKSKTRIKNLLLVPVPSNANKKPLAGSCPQQEVLSFIWAVGLRTLSPHRSRDNPCRD